MVDQALASLVSGGELAAQCCFKQDGFCAYFLSPDQFRQVAAWVGAVRAHSYRQVSPHGPEDVDLDGRDDHYWHLLILDQDRGRLAGSLRMALSSWHGAGWDGQRSYLEHCYPGLDHAFRQRNQRYAEIGRTFVAAPYRRLSPVLLMLLRAMASIPLATGHCQLLGMVSYNHFQHSATLQQRFLSALLHPPFSADPGVPPPRHPFQLPSQGPEGNAAACTAQSLGELESNLQKEFQDDFRVPLLLRKYMSFGNARVVGLSLAKDFNQICEILMHCDLTQLNPQQRQLFVLDPILPVWEGLLPAQEDPLEGGGAPAEGPTPSP
jgi:hypothetical protein